MNNGKNDKGSFRLLLEFYVMWSIGALSDEENKKLEYIAPRLRSVFSTDGTWHEIIEKRMEFPPDMPDQLRDLWRVNLEIARRHDDLLTPQRFAEMVVDENF